MKISRLGLGLTTVAVMIGFSISPAKAHADTYEIYDLGSAGTLIPSTFIVGITASGTVVLDFHIPVGAEPCKTSNICNRYETWANGVMVNQSYTAPSLVYDNGAPCTVSAPFLSSSVPGTCNNGHEVYNAGSAASIPYTDATFTGPDPVADLFAEGEVLVSDVNLNSSGDFAYNISHHAGGAGEIAEAIDLTAETPEPSSIFLLGTGLFCFAGTLRRRLF